METAKRTMRNVASQFFKFAIVVFVTIVAFALAYYFIEDYAFYQCIEWAIQTISSVGYGNYTAQTIAGSLLSSLLMLWGPFVLLAIFTAIIVNELREDPNAFTDAEQRKIMAQLDKLERLEAMIERLLEERK